MNFGTDTKQGSPLMFAAANVQSLRILTIKRVK